MDITQQGRKFEEISEIYKRGARGDYAKKMEHGLYRKSSGEWGPTFEDKYNMVRWMIYDSQISPSTKRYLRNQQHILEEWESRGVKYAIGFGILTFFFPVIRRQSIIKRSLITAFPMWFMYNHGRSWGRERWWRHCYEIVMTYEGVNGQRHLYTLK